MDDTEFFRRYRLRVLLLENYSIERLVQMMEEDPDTKNTLRTVMDEMDDSDRMECKHRLQMSILRLVQGSTRLQEMMAGIRGKCCNLAVYERIWQEIVAEVNKGGMELSETNESPGKSKKVSEVYEEVPPCKEFLDSVNWWKKDTVSMDENEARQVYRDTDWGGETLQMRRKRYRRMTARKEGFYVPSQEQDVDGAWY